MSGSGAALDRPGMRPPGLAMGRPVPMTGIPPWRFGPLPPSGGYPTVAELRTLVYCSSGTPILIDMTTDVNFLFRGLPAANDRLLGLPEHTCRFVRVLVVFARLPRHRVGRLLRLWHSSMTTFIIPPTTFGSCAADSDWILLAGMKRQGRLDARVADRRPNPLPLVAGVQ